MKKRFLAGVLCVALILCLVPTAALADTGSLIVTGGTERTDYDYFGASLYVLTGTPLTISGPCTRIVVSSGITANITLNGLSVNGGCGVALEMTGAIPCRFLNYRQVDYSIQI